MNHSVDLKKETSDEMIPVREDGSLDVKFIKKLPFEDFIEVKTSWHMNKWHSYMILNLKSM